MMKILIITPSLSSPPTKGYELILCKHIERLSLKHQVTIITFNSSKHTYNSDKTDVKSIRLSKIKSLFNSLVGVFTKDPIQVRFYKSRKMKSLIDKELNSVRYDSVIFTLIRMAQYLPPWYKGFTILNLVDPLILNYQRSLEWRSYIMKFLLGFEISRLKKYEINKSKLFNRLTLIAEADIVDYKKLLHTDKISWVPYGIDTDYFTSNLSIKRIAGMIIISGNMGYAPNIDGVKFFCLKVFPLIVEKIPNANLWIVGINPTKDIINLKTNNINVTGYVKDIRLYLNKAMVSVCPIRLKVGTQTKVLEALAMGTPVVTTSAGNHGVCAEASFHLQVADEPKDMAQKVINILEGEKWKEFSNRGIEFVNQKFNWDISIKKMEDILYKKDIKP